MLKIDSVELKIDFVTLEIDSVELKIDFVTLEIDSAELRFHVKFDSVSTLNGLSLT